MIAAIKKIPLIYRTITYLKAVQLFYQLKYRLFGVTSLSRYYPDPKKEIKFKPLTFGVKLPDAYYADEQAGFSFLNLKKKFNNGIDWNFQEFGKLWNYNLQYFNYLHQPGLNDSLKQGWLKEIGAWLKDGRLKPEPYPISLRAMNVIRYLSEKELHDIGIVSDIYAQLNYLGENIEYHLLGNHLLENAFALMMGGRSFENKRWEEKAKNILYQQLDEQILKDGGHFELSPMYHQIIFFRMLELIDWYSNSSNIDVDFLEFVKEKAGKMLSWLQIITFQNGDIPHFNDSANGIACTSAELFIFAEELELVCKDEISLSESGYRKFKNSKYECIVDAAPIGASYQPGHSHADALSFILYVDGRPVLTEAGTSTYQIGATRDIERSTSSHNTVDINGVSQSEVWGGFRVGGRANVKITTDKNDIFIASHDGYKQKFNAVHQREFNFGESEVVIKDSINTSSDIVSSAYFHFHPDCEIVQQDNKNFMINSRHKLSIENADNSELKKFNYSTGFNQCRTSVGLAVHFRKHLETCVSFL